MRLSLALVSLFLAGCLAPAPEGLAFAEAGPGPKVKFDIFHTPLPEVPLPNDFATRYDGASPTRRRINASIDVAPTKWERATRAGLDGISGWGTLAPISVSFTAPLDVRDIVRRHRAAVETADDAMYVIDVTEESPDLCQPQLLDLGQGHFPAVLDRREYYPDEPHANDETLLFEQDEEDTNANGIMDPGEDTDMDGVLDHPNTLDGKPNRWEPMTFYERETNTLLARPLYPMREKTTYAVVLTTRLKDVDGNPVRSPFDAINHASQTGRLEQLPRCLSQLGLSLADVAFTWSFTTQSTTADYIALRDGLHGLGKFQYLGAQFPPDITTLEDVRIRKARDTNTKILPGADFLDFGQQLFSIYGGSQTNGTKKVFEDALKFVDFYASGNFASPQFFPRQDSEGNLLPLYDQVWRVDPNTGVAYLRSEAVPFFMGVPKFRKGKPAPVVVWVHGHSSSKLDSLLLMGPMARMGIATIGIDAVSHGVGLSDLEKLAVAELVKPYGLDPMAKAILQGRGVDWNNDGIVDSGADYYTAYVIHTRDVMRQTAIDEMQLVRVLRSFDGVRRWKHDVNRDGEDDIAGDFDGDGVVDIGGPDTPIYVAGASLGGIISSLVSGLEPEVDATLAVLPGGYLSEIGTRTDLGQVRDPLVLRMMSPLFLVHPDKNGEAGLFQMVHEASKGKELQLAKLPALLTPNHIVVARNTTTGEWRCGRVQPNGHLRVAVPSDKGDSIVLELYDHELTSQPREGCNPGRSVPYKSISTLELEVSFLGQTFEAGSPLIAFADGFGLRRSSPDLRRLFNLAQVGLEVADPANFAPFYEGARTLTYGDGKTVATRSLMVPMTGDPGVPIATATALLRAAGHLDYKNIDPRYMKTQMQVLIDEGIVEGVERTGRFKDPNGKNVLMDPDSLMLVANADDGFNAPRLNPPMRLLRPSAALGGTVGTLFPMMDPEGAHSFPVPDPDRPGFDLGMMLINIFTTYIGNGGEALPLDACLENTTCSWIPPAPP
jgi:hypothetical protein